MDNISRCQGVNLKLSNDRLKVTAMTISCQACKSAIFIESIQMHGSNADCCGRFVRFGCAGAQKIKGVSPVVLCSTAGLKHCSCVRTEDYSDFWLFYKNKKAALIKKSGFK